MYPFRRLPRRLFLQILENETKILTPEYLQGIMDIFNGLEQGSIAKVSYFSISEPGAGVIVSSNKSWKLLFQPDKDIKAQINNLKVILQNSSPEEYIDLRYGERVYWK